MADRLDQLTQLYDADPNDPFLSYGIALELGKAERLTEAIDWLNKTLALDAHYCYAYYQKAKMQSAGGDDPAARQTLHDGMAAAEAAGDAHARDEIADLLNSLE